jgi:membrane fusion protein (multidrug efflux system)
MKRSAKIVIAVIVLALVGIGTLTYRNRESVVSTELISEVIIQKRPVQTVVLAPQTLQEKLFATGVLGAEQDVIMQSEVAGRVKKVHKQLGEKCRRGETLVQLDPETYQIAVAQAKAMLAQSKVRLGQAKRDWDRMQALKESAVATAQQLDQAASSQSTAAAALEQAQATLRGAQRNLRETTIKCPFSGYVAEEKLEVGQTVGPNISVARLVDLKKLKLTLNVTSASLSRIRAGQSVELTDPALPEQTYRGVVSRLGVAADANTRNFPVEVQVDESEGALRAGQIVHATLALKEHVDVLSIPVESLITRIENNHVFVVVDGIAKKKTVRTGPQIGEQIIVLDGLKNGDEVVSIGGQELTDGTEVEVIRRLDKSSNLSLADGAPTPDN